jgi:hypothetical protein
MINEIRTILLAVIPLTNDAIHVYIRMLCLLSTCLLFRRSLAWWPALTPETRGFCADRDFRSRAGFPLDQRLVPFLID